MEDREGGGVVCEVQAADGIMADVLSVVRTCVDVVQIRGYCVVLDADGDGEDVETWVDVGSEACERCRGIAMDGCRRERGQGFYRGLVNAKADPEMLADTVAKVGGVCNKRSGGPGTGGERVGDECVEWWSLGWNWRVDVGIVSDDEHEAF